MRFLFFALLGFTSLSGLSQDAVMNKVKAGFESGNVGLFQAHLKSEIDFTYADTDDLCSKSEVSSKLRTFFSTHKPQRFTVKHKGTGRSHEIYRIGELVTNNGTFRVTIFIEKTGNGYQVGQIKIE